VLTITLRNIRRSPDFSNAGANAKNTHDLAQHFREASRFDLTTTASTLMLLLRLPTYFRSPGERDAVIGGERRDLVASAIDSAPAYVARCGDLTGDCRGTSVALERTAL
jgi:hypothetical protein